MSADVTLPDDGRNDPVPPDARIVVVGAGHAAGRFAERLRHFGHDGEILLIGEEEFPPYERPYLSKTVLTDPEEPAFPAILPPDADIRHVAGTRVVSIDRAGRTVMLAGGGQEPWDALVLATGMRPRTLECLDGLGGPFIALRSLSDARRLRGMLRPGAAVVIIGAGFIGLEVASSLRGAGIGVEIVDTMRHPLGRALPPVLGDALAGRHRAHGVRFHFGCSVVAAALRREGITLTLDDGSEIHADVVIQGIGGIANDDLARDCGIEVAGGALVNTHGRTSDTSVWAIGDVARRRDALGNPGLRLESWRNAEDSAARAAAAIRGLARSGESDAHYFWSDQLGGRIQMFGLPDPAAVLHDCGMPFMPGYAAFFLRDGRLRQAITVDAPAVQRMARKLLRGGGEVAASDLAALGMSCRAAEDAVRVGVGAT